MATMQALRAEYEVLITTHRRLIDERTQLNELTDGGAFQDHGHRMRAYLTALDTYVLALDARRRELHLRKHARTDTEAPVAAGGLLYSNTTRTG